MDALVWGYYPSCGECRGAAGDLAAVATGGRSGEGRWSAALALVAGFAAGQVGIEGWPPFPPREAADWLWNCTLAAVALSFLDAWRSCPFWLRWLVRAALWLAVVWFLLPPDIRKEASRGVLLSWLVGLELAGLLYWSLLALTARRLPGVMLPLILLIVSVGSVLVLHCGHISKLTLLASACSPRRCFRSWPEAHADLRSRWRRRP